LYATPTNNNGAEYNACSDDHEEVPPLSQSASNLQTPLLDSTSTSRTRNMVFSDTMNDSSMTDSGNTWQMLHASPTLSNMSFTTGCKRALFGFVDGEVNNPLYISASSATNYGHSNHDEEGDSSFRANQTRMNVKMNLSQNNHRDSQSTGLNLLTSISPLTLPNEQTHLHAHKLCHSVPSILGEGVSNECTVIEKTAYENDDEIEMYGLNIQKNNNELISSMSSIFSTDSNSSGTMHITPHDITNQAYEVRKRPRDEPVFFDIEETY